jgi:heterodisulfide reductase subunit A
MTAALSLAGQGFRAHIIEKGDELGGRLRFLRHTLEGEDPGAVLDQLLGRIASSELISVHRGARIADFSGHVGNYRTKILTGDEELELEHGIVILATGGVEYKPVEYGYGLDPRILTQVELEDRLFSGDPCFDSPRDVVMIQCVGSREENHPYCSRVCCGHAVKNALEIKRRNPDSRVHVFFRDIRTYGKMEEHYRAAREAGVIFIRYEPESGPEVSAGNGNLALTGFDPMLGREISFRPDFLILSSAIRPQPDARDLSARLKVSLTSEGSFLEAHLKLRPLDFATGGMFLCGLAHSPKRVQESIAQARGAAARAASILSRSHLSVPGTTARVDPDICAACLTCVRACPFEVPVVREGAAFIEAAMCQGCGTCAAACPAKAIELGHYKDGQIIAQLAGMGESMFEGDREL